MTTPAGTPQGPLVSVVVITYNAAEYVGHAIESVLQQTWQNLELIVVDDGSTDDTQSLVQRVGDDRLRYVRQANQGPSAARNRGIRESRGEFVAFLDADDWWSPEKLCRQVAAARPHPDVGLIYSFAVGVDGAGKEIGRMNTVVNGRVIERLLLGQCIAGSASSVMVTRKAIDTVGVFDESLHHAEDWEYWIRVASRFEVACVPEYDVHLLSRPGSHGKNPLATRDQSLSFIHGALARYAPGRPWFRRVALAEIHYVAGYNFWTSGYLARARREILRAWLYNPFYLVYYKRMVRLFFPRATRARNPG
jgi:glycosyltransferase involved in cell wall biosynthesis